MTEYWPFLAAGICVLAVVRCAARQRHGVRSLLAGARGAGRAWAAGTRNGDRAAADPFYSLLRGCFGRARGDGAAGSAAAVVTFACQGAVNMLYFLENEWNIRRRDSPQGLPEESPGFTDTE